MADHYVSLNQGEEGFTPSDFTTGTASTSTNQIELRVKDGAGLSKMDVHKAIQAFERFFEDPTLVANAGFDVSG